MLKCPYKVDRNVNAFNAIDAKLFQHPQPKDQTLDQLPLLEGKLTRNVKNVNRNTLREKKSLFLDQDWGRPERN